MFFWGIWALINDLRLWQKANEILHGLIFINPWLLQYAICTLFTVGDLCLLYIWTHKRQAIWEYMQAMWFVKMIYSVTVLWSGTFLFSQLWCCKVITTPFVQLNTRVYDRPTKLAKFMSATCRGSKIDFFAVLTILCSIEWSRSAVGS